MTKLPDASILGKLPAVTVSGITPKLSVTGIGEGQAAAARSLEAAGSALSKIGEDQLSQQNKLQEAQAQGDFSIESGRLYEQWSNDPDYQRAPGAYRDQAHQALLSAAQRINDPNNRTLFVQKYRAGIENNALSLADLSRRRGNEDTLLKNDERIGLLSDQALANPDEMFRAQKLHDIRAIIDGEVTARIISPTQGRQRVRQFIQRYGEAYTNELISRDPDKADGLLAKTPGDEFADPNAPTPRTETPIDFLRPDQVVRLRQQANMTKQARASDMERQKLFAEREVRRVSDAEENQLLKDIYGDNPSVTARTVVNNDKLTREAKERMIGVVGRANKPEPPSRVSAVRARDLLDDIRRPTGDRFKITDMGPLYDAYTKGDLTRTDFEFVRKEFLEARSDGGEKLTRRKDDFIKGIAHQIDLSNPLMNRIDQTGKEQLYKFEFDVDRRIEEYRKAGRDPFDLFNPSSPDYVGRPEVIAPYQKTLAQSAKDQADALRRQAEALSGKRLAAPKQQPADPLADTISTLRAAGFSEAEIEGARKDGTLAVVKPSSSPVMTPEKMRAMDAAVEAAQQRRKHYRLRAEPNQL